MRTPCRYSLVKLVADSDMANKLRWMARAEGGLLIWAISRELRVNLAMSVDRLRRHSRS